MLNINNRVQKYTDQAFSSGDSKTESGGSRDDENSTAAEHAIFQKGKQNSVNYCRYGDAEKPLILVLGGISANQYAADYYRGGATIRGWWNDFIGSDKAIDLNQFQVLSVDYYAGTAFDAATGQHVSTHHQAKLLDQLLLDLNIESIEAVIGGSYGGMVGLAFAELFPSKLQKLVVLCAADKSSVKSMGLREIQRKIIELGLDCKKENEAFSLARSSAIRL